MKRLEKALNEISDIGFAHPNDEDLQLLCAKAKGLMVGYEKRWRDDVWTVDAIESEFTVPIVNPATGAASRTFVAGGKRDGLLRQPSTQFRFLMEHKTTSEDIESPDAPYFKRLTIDSQISHYFLSSKMEGIELDGVLYDIIRKPQTKPKAISKKIQDEMNETGRYYGFPILDSEKVLTFETLRMYQRRVAHDAIVKSSYYFNRRMIYRTDVDLGEYQQELWDISKAILHARKHDAHYRNSDACVQWNYPCEFLDICSGADSEDSERWVPKQKVHVELQGVGEDGGRNLLTNSRIKTFQSCRRKHYYAYEKGIIRKGKKEAEALIMGNIMHRALEKWWEGDD